MRGECTALMHPPEADHWLSSTENRTGPQLRFFSPAEPIFPKLREAVTLQLLIGFGSSDVLGLCTPRYLSIRVVFPRDP